MFYPTDFITTYVQNRHTSPGVLAALYVLLTPERSEAGLDLGCGTGNYTVPFLDKLRSVTGVDISREMLEVARKRSDAVDWREGDLATYELTSGAFDKVWAVLCVHHLRDKQRPLFREVYKTLRPGGRFVAFTQFAEQADQMWLPHYFPTIAQGWEKKYQTSVTLRQWLTEAGFTGVQCLPFHITDSVESFLRVGERTPELYLEKDVIRSNPVGLTLTDEEYQSGMRALRADVESGAIKRVIADYDTRTRIPGQYGLVVANKA